MNLKWYYHVHVAALRASCLLRRLVVSQLVRFADPVLRNSQIYVLLFSGDRCILDYAHLRNHSHWLIYNKIYFSRKPRTTAPTMNLN